MADIALDDLIQKDKQQKKGASRIKRNQPLQRRGGGHIPNNQRGAPNKRGDIRFPNRGNARQPGRVNGPPNRFDNRSLFRQNEAPVNKHKPIQKNNQRAERVLPQAPQEKQDDRTLKVMGLHPDFTNQDLYKLFASQGAMEKCLIEQDNFGRSQTTAVVKYHNPSSAINAIKNLNQHKVMNSILTVEPYRFKRR